MEKIHEFRKDGFLISTDKTKLNVKTVHTFLHQSYWARGISLPKIEKCIAHSLCFGLYHNLKQIGFARVITDFARIAHIADVFVLKAYRGQGLGKWLMRCILDHPDLQEIPRWTLRTRDAHDLYSQYGFHSLRHPEFFMEKQTEQT